MKINSKLTSLWGHVLNKKIQMLTKIKKPQLKEKKSFFLETQFWKIKSIVKIDKILRFAVNYLWD